MTTTTLPPLLAADGITFAYRAGEPVVRHWSAGFPACTTTALTGPSGSGKSTLLYLLELMLRPGPAGCCLTVPG
jgi:ABC-type multidrug transport system fused ATPase/permease subunit